MVFWAYMLHCRGGKFYAGHTDDLEQRVAQHKSGLIEGFTKDRLPVELVWSQDFPTRYEAISAEMQIKGWSRAKKLALIRGDWDAVSRYARSKNGPSTSSGRTVFVVGKEASSGQAEIIFSSQALAAMRAAAAAAHPHEACGLLLGEAECITAALETRNVHPAPATHFEIDPQALIDAHRAARSGGPQVLGYFHSHPLGLAEPSATDRASAAKDGRIWAILAGNDIRLWRDEVGGFAPLSYAMADR